MRKGIIAYNIEFPVSTIPLDLCGQIGRTNINISDRFYTWKNLADNLDIKFFIFNYRFFVILMKN